jgi:hypothetical protein
MKPNNIAKLGKATGVFIVTAVGLILRVVIKRKK